MSTAKWQNIAGSINFFTDNRIKKRFPDMYLFGKHFEDSNFSKSAPNPCQRENYWTSILPKLPYHVIINQDLSQEREP